MRKRRRPFTSQATEHDEARAFWEWLQRTKPEGWDCCFHIRNEGAHAGERVRKAAEGVVAGIPDYLYAYPSGGWPGLFIELKNRDGGRYAKKQVEIINRLRSVGYVVAICHGADEAIATVEHYLRHNIHLPPDLQIVERE